MPFDEQLLMADDCSNDLTEGYFKWRCRRGMKELDFIFNRYLTAKYSVMTTDDKQLFDDLLKEEDMQLWYWMSGKTMPTVEQHCFKQLVVDICEAAYLKK